VHVHGSGGPGGDKNTPEVVSYCYLGIEFAKNDSHVQKVINSGKKKLNQLHT